MAHLVNIRTQGSRLRRDCWLSWEFKSQSNPQSKCHLRSLSTRTCSTRSKCPRSKAPTTSCKAHSSRVRGVCSYLRVHWPNLKETSARSSTSCRSQGCRALWIRGCRTAESLRTRMMACLSSTTCRRMSSMVSRK